MMNAGFPLILTQRSSRYEAQNCKKIEGISIIRMHEADALARDLIYRHGITVTT